DPGPDADADPGPAAISRPPLIVTSPLATSLTSSDPATPYFSMSACLTRPPSVSIASITKSSPRVSIRQLFTGPGPQGQGKRPTTARQDGGQLRIQSGSRSDLGHPEGTPERRQDDWARGGGVGRRVPGRHFPLHIAGAAGDPRGRLHQVRCPRRERQASSGHHDRPGPASPSGPSPPSRRNRRPGPQLQPPDPGRLGDHLPPAPARRLPPRRRHRPSGIGRSRLPDPSSGSPARTPVLPSLHPQAQRP